MPPLVTRKFCTFPEHHRKLPKEILLLILISRSCFRLRYYKNIHIFFRISKMEIGPILRYLKNLDPRSSTCFLRSISQDLFKIFRQLQQKLDFSVPSGIHFLTFPQQLRKLLTKITLLISISIDLFAV